MVSFNNFVCVHYLHGKFTFCLFQPGNNLVTASKAAVPTVSDPSSAMQLNNVSKNLANALAELKAAAAKVSTKRDSG